jgi:hypothetical protein
MHSHYLLAMQLKKSDLFVKKKKKSDLQNINYKISKPHRIIKPCSINSTMERLCNDDLVAIIMLKIFITFVIQFLNFENCQFSVSLFLFFFFF